MLGGGRWRGRAAGAWRAGSGRAVVRRSSACGREADLPRREPGRVCAGPLAAGGMAERLALLAGTLPASSLAGLRLIVTPATIVRWHRDTARRRRAQLPRRDGPAAGRCAGRCGRRCCAWLGRTSYGGTGASTVSWPGPGSSWRRRRCGRSSRTPGQAPLRAGTALAGRSSCGPGRRGLGCLAFSGQVICI
jgi:hypothetical protein